MTYGRKKASFAPAELPGPHRGDPGRRAAAEQMCIRDSRHIEPPGIVAGIEGIERAVQDGHPVSYTHLTAPNMRGKPPLLGELVRST